jgi:hypothetical protein
MKKSEANGAEAEERGTRREEVANDGNNDTK